MTPSIIFDFDGTLVVGHAPVLAYARTAAPSTNFMKTVEEELRAFDRGETSYRDGYDLVAQLAAEAGVTPVALEEAYAHSRTYLGTDEAPVEALPEIADFLSSLHQRAELCLATNAPAVGVERVLDSWGVRGHFDQLHVNVGKPTGLRPIVADLMKKGRVLSIGDIVDYDLAPALELGADTALVGATAVVSPAEVTFRGDTLVDLYDPILAWAKGHSLQE